MTAPILQPGDRIHLAFPVSPMLVGRELDARIREAQAGFTEGYGHHGVTITTFSWSSALTHPTVVAVFRPAAGSGVTS